MDAPFSVSGIFQDAEDRRREAAVAELLEREWKCQIGHFADLNPVDWYCYRERRITGVLELKCRNHSSTHYPTVFLSFAKYTSLVAAGYGLRCPPGFVVRFTDKIMWIRVMRIDPRNSLMGGRSDRGAEHDYEPIIEVPIEHMSVVCDTPQDLL